MLSLYRRHRPKTFDEVVGQESVVRTLRNAIELGKVHHAYLFVGSRGTGKTSTAKLLACALNAEGGPAVDFDPETAVSQAIMAGTSLDVVEMDAASNNSVDDIRELRENVSLAPMGGSKRVYILDEAHMLSTAAWNAFLKTLEEPPGHVVFVLATTEAHKVPATIVDRCHRFDFQRPSLEQIAGVVKRVSVEEGITIPDPAVGMIARKATGSFRDALGTLEQLVTYGGKDVDLDDVLVNLGVADAGLILDTAETLAGRDPRQALLAVQRLAESGRDEVQFMRDLSAHLRHLYVVQTMGEVPDSFAVTAEHTDRLAAQAERLSQTEVLRAIDLLAAALAAVKDGSEPRLQLEVALLKATQPRADQSLQALMFRIDELEARLGGEAPAPLATPAPSTEPAASAPADAPPPVPTPTPTPPLADSPPAPVVPEVAVPEPTAPEPAAPETDTEPTAPVSEAGVEAPVQPPAPPARSAAGGSAVAAPEPVAEQPVAPPPAPVAPTPQESGQALDLERIKDLWPAVADAVREQNGMVAALLIEAVPAEIDGDRLIVRFPEDAVFSKKKAEANRELVLSAMRSLVGQPIALAFELGGTREELPTATLGEDELAERLKRDFGAEEVFDDPDPEAKD